jgi:hypothetical protein
MAHISEFTIVTYQRKPACWRAAISRKDHSKSVVGSDTVLSLVTPDDSASEAAALLAAEQLIRKLPSRDH